jgi:hypothetical protein
VIIEIALSSLLLKADLEKVGNVKVYKLDRHIWMSE